MAGPLTTLQPAVDVRVDERTDEDLRTGEPKVAHMTQHVTSRVLRAGAAQMGSEAEEGDGRGAQAPAFRG